jgi:Cu(I)/Ag(I) efflux system periplasmic protein CusF
MNKPLKSLILAACLAAAGPAWSADGQGNAAPQTPASNATANATTMTDGEVKKVDKDNGKVTLKHGEIKNLGMPGMTMVFKVKDPAMLDKLQPGDKVRFSAERAGGAITVTQMESAK